MPFKIKHEDDQFVVTKDSASELARHDTKVEAVKQLRGLYAAHDVSELVGIEVARGHKVAGVECYEEACERAFLNFDKMVEHAEAVHTFDDVRKMVHEVVRETYGRTGDYKATPPVPSIWTWVEDLASDWVVFTVEEGNDTRLLKASYSILDNNVTLGEPVEVRRRTVYDAVTTNGA